MAWRSSPAEASPAAHWLGASWPWLLAAGAAAGLAMALALLPLPPRATIAIGDLMQLAAAATAAAACLAQSRRPGAARTGWLLLGLGAAAWAGGQAAWTWYEAVRGVPAPIPSLADLGFLAMVPLALAGLLRLAPLPRGVRLPGALLLDGLLSMLAAFVLAWPLVLSAVFDQAGGTWRAWFAIAYPLTDIAILGLAGGILLRGRAAFRSALGLAYVAFLLIAVADLGLATGVFNDTYATGQFADAGWIAGFLVLAAATRAPPPQQVEPWTRYGQRIGHLLPILAMAAAAASFAVALWRQDVDDLPWRLGVGATVLAALARQVLSENEFRAMAREREQAQARYRDLFHHAVDGIFQAGADGALLDCNDAFARIAGYPAAAELRAAVHTLAELYADRRDLDALLGRLARDGVAVGPALRLRRRDGGLAWVEADLRAVRGPGGVERLEGFLRDVTAQHSLARMLRVISLCNQASVHASDEQALLDEVCSVMVETGGYHLCWIGFAQDDAAKTVRPVAWAGRDGAYVHRVQASWSADDPRGQGPTGRAIREGGVQVAQDILTDPAMAPWRKDALERGYAASCSLPMDLDGSRGALMVYATEAKAFGPDEVGLLTELTQDLAYGVRALRARAARDRAESALRASEENNRRLVAESPIGLVRVAPDGAFLEANPAAVALYGMASREALLRANVKDFYVDPAERAERLSEAESPQGQARRLTLLKRPDGTRVWVRSNSTAVRDPAGTVLYYQGTLEDVTAQRAAEEAKAAAERAQRELERQTQEIKRLDELSQMRMEFLNTAAHDLNTPLTPLKLELAVFPRKGPLNEKQQASLAMLERNVNRFQVLVEDMLDAARLQSGRLKLNLGPTALDHLVAETVAAFEEPARQGQVRIQVAPLPAVQVQADSSKLQQVLFNLMSNAVKYTPAGGQVDVRITTTPKEAVVAFTDTGLGMTPEQLGRLFQPFVRLHEAVAGVAKGTGLGLYISKGLVEQHGGRIWAESAGPGKGSTFSIALPFPAAGPAAA